MAMIVRTTSGTWKAVIRKKGWPTVAKTFRLRRDAADWGRHAEDGMVQGTYLHRSAAGKVLFAEVIDRYLREVTTTKRPRTQRTDRHRAVLLRECFGTYSLAAITPDLIADYRDRRLASRSRSDRHRQLDPPPFLSPATVRLELILLNHVLATAMREWRLDLPRNPIACVRMPRTSEPRTRRLHPGEERRLTTALAKHANPMLGLIFRLALETGMRAGEIRTLRMSQVDLNARVILLTDTKNRSTRTVPLSRRATETLCIAMSTASRPSGCDYVFHAQPRPSHRCGCYMFQNDWYILRNALGMRDLRFHDLRHEAISRLVEAGLSDLEVAAISGHKAMQMLKRYTHLRAQGLVMKLDRLEGRRGRRVTTRPLRSEVPSVMAGNQL